MIFLFAFSFLAGWNVYLHYTVPSLGVSVLVGRKNLDLISKILHNGLHVLFGIA